MSTHHPVHPTPIRNALPLPGRRTALRLIGASSLAALAAGTLSACTTQLPDEALTAWAVANRSRPAAGADPRAWILAHAILAPHSHNLQSWIADVRTPGAIVLSCDLKRLLPATDPHSRQIMMSHGTFIELVDLAAREIGWRADVELFPRGVFGPDRLDDRPVAHIRLTADGASRPDPLFAQIPRRHTNREPYSPRPPAQAACERIVAAAQAPGLTTGIERGDQPQAIGLHRAIAKAAWRIELTTPPAILESYQWLRIGPGEIARHRDGLSIMDPMARVATTLGLFDRSKAPASDDRNIARQIERFEQTIDSTPAFLWMRSASNTRAEQVAAGRAWVRAQLAATAEGLAMQPISQALQEYPEQAKPYREIHELVGAGQQGATVQMWARLGEGPTVGPAPRRGVQAHLVA